MEYPLVMEMGHRLKNISDDDGGRLLRKLPLLAEFLVELSVAAQFEDYVDVDVVLIVRVKLHDMRMLQRIVDFYLAEDLVGEALLGQLLFVY